MQLLGKATDPEFWKQVKEKDCFKKYRDELFSLWNERCENKPIESLRYSEFSMFYKDGNRSVYEKSYFNHRLCLDCSALLSLIYPEEEKYVNYLMDIIYAVCDEYTWCLAAHQGQIEKSDTTRVDLFASETAFTLSEIYTMLGDRLEPLIRDRIRTEIDRRVITTITSCDNYGWWENGTSNWTAVCMGSVGCTFMLMRPELVPTMKPRFDASMEKYLSGFRDDGMCLEGCGYWHYGFGFFVVYADMIRTFTNGETDYFKREKVKTIATFMQKMYLSGKTTVSFADGGLERSFHLGLLHYLKKEYPDVVKVYSPEYSYNYDSCGRFCLQLRSATWFSEEYYNKPDEQANAVYYAPDSEWFVLKTPNYGFAAKGGCNAEHHNHNDVGSFIFAKNGRQMLMDIGSGVYTRNYFGKERYKNIHCSSRGHSVPLINGSVQPSGADAKATGTKYENGVFSTDISSAYRVSGLEKLLRSFSFTDDEVTLTDEIVYTGEGNVTERIVSLSKATLFDGYVKVDEAEIHYDKELCVPVINTETTPENKTCYFVDFVLPAGTEKFSVRIK